MLLELNVRELLREVASDSPAPGGGSVSALAGALGTALVSMAGNLSGDAPEGRRVLGQVLAGVPELLEGLAEAVEEDTAAAVYEMGATVPRG